jgi:fucose permease
MSETIVPTTAKVRTKRPIGLILLIFVAFIALGMPDGLLGVGWPTIRADFGLPLDAIGMLLFASMAGYLSSSFFSGAILRRWHVSKVLIVSCVTTAVGLIGYTLVPEWWMMVALGILAGLGAGTIDSGLNNYVASHFGPGLMQWLHASYGIGVTSGPLLMTLFITHFAEWRYGYLIVGGFQLLLGLVFWFTLPMWAKNEPKEISSDTPTEVPHKPSLWKTLSSPRVWLSMGMFFLYTGVEVILGTWTFSLLTEARGVKPELAGLFAGSYWFMFTVGRVLAGVVTRKMKIERVVLGSLLMAILGSLLLLLSPLPITSLVAVALIGFAFAPIFPGLMSGTAKRVGVEHVENAIGIQAASAGLGGTALTSLVGVMAAKLGLEVMPIMLIVFLVLLMGLFVFSSRKNSSN